jgi:hypothetical protein
MAFGVRSIRTNLEKLQAQRAMEEVQRAMYEKYIDKMDMQLQAHSTPMGRGHDIYRTVTPIAVKIESALNRVCTMLPFCLVNKLVEVRFGPTGALDPTFEVVFKGGKIVAFDNLDTFPTDADIACIALECP